MAHLQTDSRSWWGKGSVGSVAATLQDLGVTFTLSTFAKDNVDSCRPNHTWLCLSYAKHVARLRLYSALNDD